MITLDEMMKECQEVYERQAEILGHTLTGWLYPLGHKRYALNICSTCGTVAIVDLDDKESFFNQGRIDYQCGTEKVKLAEIRKGEAFRWGNAQWVKREHKRLASFCAELMGDYRTAWIKNNLLVEKIE
jgi:hypothetical protein